MNEELKRCPFCNSEATFADDKLPNGDTIYFIGCKQRGCVAYMRSIGNSYYELKNAIHAWNRRADDGNS